MSPVKLCNDWLDVTGLNNDFAMVWYHEYEVLFWKSQICLATILVSLEGSLTLGIVCDTLTSIIDKLSISWPAVLT